jgi:hypothetical protein
MKSGRWADGADRAAVNGKGGAMRATKRAMVMATCLGAAILLLAVPALADDAPARTVVINEVELNPAGFDTNAEWVELLNVSDATVDLAGWTLSYNYRSAGTAIIAETSTALAPGGRYVFVYPGLRLRNAEPIAIRLVDADGTLIDVAPGLTDVGDSDFTWQRFPDGGDPLIPDLWLYLEATRGKPNS